MNRLQDILAWKYAPLGFKYSCGETYDSLIAAEDNEYPKPTLEDIEQAAQEYTAYKEQTSYIAKRLKEYPTIAELTVALWEHVIEGRPERAEALQVARLEVKQKYPGGTHYDDNTRHLN